jgi:hypothetical protein
MIRRLLQARRVLEPPQRQLRQQQNNAPPPLRRQRLPNGLGRGAAHDAIQASARLPEALRSPESATRGILSTYKRHLSWDIDTALKELKIYVRGAGIVLRSRTEELIKQEFFGLMMSHYAIRGLTHEAALKADRDPDRLSFIHAIRVVRRKLPVFGGIPPVDRPKLHEEVLAEILDEPVPPRRNRRNKRGVKRKLSPFPVRRKADRPLPPVDIAKAIRIITTDRPSSSPRPPRPRRPRGQTPCAARAPTAADHPGAATSHSH